MTQLSKEHESHKTHHLKIYPEHFSAVLTGVKRAELRKNDRDYKVGDILHLMETPKGSCSPTGEFVNAVVTHIADVGEWLPGYVLLSIEREPLYAAPQPVAVPDEIRLLQTEIIIWKDRWEGLRELFREIANELGCDVKDNDAIIEKIRAMKSVTWIPCSERMPRANQNVYLANTDYADMKDRVFIGWLESDKHEHFFIGNQLMMKATHWMEIGIHMPTIPTEDK